LLSNFTQFEDTSMRSATAAAPSANTAQMEQATAAVNGRVRLQSAKEEMLLKVDLSDLVLPKVNDLQVDGLKANWFARLFGKR
jgi:hypothetical protein